MSTLRLGRGDALRCPDALPLLEDMRAAFRAATMRNAATPVFCGSALRNRGIQRIPDGVVF